MRFSSPVLAFISLCALFSTATMACEAVCDSFSACADPRSFAGHKYCAETRTYWRLTNPNSRPSWRGTYPDYSSCEAQRRALCGESSAGAGALPQNMQDALTCSARVSRNMGITLTDALKYCM